MPPLTSPPLAPPAPPGHRAPSDAACEVLGRALDVILRDPDGWDQDVYCRRDDAAVPSSDEAAAAAAPACGTAFCVAGHVAVTVLGHEPAWRQHPSGRWFADLVLDGRVLVAVDTVAARALELVDDVHGVADDRADLLFHQRASLRRVVELAFLYTGGRVDRFAAYAALVAARPDVGTRDVEREDEDAAARLDNLLYRRDLDERDDVITRPTADRAYWEWELS